MKRYTVSKLYPIFTLQRISFFKEYNIRDRRSRGQMHFFPTLHDDKKTSNNKGASLVVSFSIIHHFFLQFKAFPTASIIFYFCYGINRRFPRNIAVFLKYKYCFLRCIMGKFMTKRESPVPSHFRSPPPFIQTFHYNLFFHSFVKYISDP